MRHVPCYDSRVELTKIIPSKTEGPSLDLLKDTKVFSLL